MNEDEKKITFNYEEEKAKLKKKLTIFIVITVAFTLLFQLMGNEDTSFVTNLGIGALFGIVFYIPGRIQDYLHTGWLMTIVIAVVYLLALIFLIDKIGPIGYILLLFPIADMAYSIYKVTSCKNSNGED